MYNIYIYIYIYRYFSHTYIYILCMYIYIYIYNMLHYMYYIYVKTNKKQKKNIYIYTLVTGLWAGYLELSTFYTTSESSWWKQHSENRVLLRGAWKLPYNFLRKKLDSPPPRASGEGGILYIEFWKEVCVPPLGGGENPKKSLSPLLTD